MVAPADRWSHAAGASSDLGQPRRLFRRWSGHQAVAAPAGTPGQAPAAACSTSTRPALQPGIEHPAPPGRRCRSQAVRALGMRPDPVSQEIRQGQCDIARRTGQPLCDLPSQQRSAIPAYHGRADPRAAIPAHLARRSITFDRGTEFTDWPYLQPNIGTQTWFCDPQSPWQKGTVENTNGRVRKWLSREVDPLSVTDADLLAVCNRLYSTPQKCLGYRHRQRSFERNCSPR
ncbi:hypothetical protein ACVITL_004725 [Rhizobium pisi]